MVVHGNNAWHKKYDASASDHEKMLNELDVESENQLKRNAHVFLAVILQ